MRLILLLVQAPLGLMVLYLDVLTVAAALWRRAPAPAAPRARFAILVPAHDEEKLLPRLLDSFAALDYPRELYDVHVVADNCTDNTAAVARAAGAIVHERTDTEQRGKGYALRWLLAEIGHSGQHYDALVVVDADSVASANMLTVMNAHLARGDEAVQCYYGVLNADESWQAGLRYVALALFNALRPRGRDALGLSVGLRGNGMCFAAQTMARFGWEAFTLAEDAEFHMQLVAAGSKVTYAGEATVLAEMPVSLRQAQSQNVRWERGRLHMLRAYGMTLLREGLRKRDPVRLDALAEQLIPPLSVLTGLATLFLALTSITQPKWPRMMARAIALGQVVYVAGGLRLVKARPRAYAAVLLAPVYVAWKLWIYLIAAAGLRDNRWIRTPRQ